VDLAPDLYLFYIGMTPSAVSRGYSPMNMDELHGKLRGVATRMRLGRGLRAAVDWGLLGGTGASLAAAIGAFGWRHWLSPAPAIFGVAMLAGFAWAARRRISAFQAAIAVDRAENLSERVATAVEVAGRGTEAARAVVADALSAASRVEFAGVERLRPPARARFLVLPAGALALLALLPILGSRKEPVRFVIVGVMDRSISVMDEKARKLPDPGRRNSAVRFVALLRQAQEEAKAGGDGPASRRAAERLQEKLREMARDNPDLPEELLRELDALRGDIAAELAASGSKSGPARPDLASVKIPEVSVVEEDKPEYRELLRRYFSL